MMYNLMDSSSPIMAALYFIMLVVFGSFFSINLILAVIMDSFDKVEKDTKQEERDK